ncbi:MAG: T9SS type A sorting domain-containing protein [Bacteroidales bacterium]|nr:T9SS type A sorting domain-containing protein [Bacteroidales bacterium]
MKQRYTSIPKYARFLAIAVFFAATSITLQAQSITLLAPNGGEAWLVDSYEDVSWTGQGLGNVLKLEFSPDGGVDWWYFGEVNSAPNGGSAMVFVPPFLSQNALLKITDISNPAVSDISDATFTVSYPPISIYEPSSNYPVFANTLTYVNWALYQQGITLLNAEISTDNGLTYSPLAQNLDAFLGYTYLNLSETPANACILKLYDAADPSTFSLSQVFQVIPAPVYTITSPVEGQIVNVNSLLTISWNVQNLYEAENYIEFSPDNGETWEVIAYGMSQGTSGSVVWYTPNVSSDECLIRINDSYSLSSIDVSDVFTIMPYPETPICMVTVDSLTNQNMIIWEKPASDLITDFLVYKETDEFDVYEVIDTVSYQDVPMATDFESNPAIRPYRYKLGFMDSENRVFPASDFHQTIHLTISQGINGNWNLIWTPYAGFDYTSYKIMRKSGNGPFEQIASISASFTSFTDFDAPSGDIAYMVKIVNPEGCSTGLRDAAYTDVYSNQASASLVSAGGIGKTGFSIYPVPANDQINIQYGDNTKGIIKLTITDVTGRIIYSAEYTDVFAGQALSINTSAYTEGMYLLNIVTSGERIQRNS